MERRRLGATDMELSVIGLGTWVFGGRWGGADDADSLAACHAAIDAGVNWIDTADIYGQGRAERIVGQAVRERRDEVFVATKGGVAWDSGPPLTHLARGVGRLPAHGLRPQPPGPRPRPHRPLPGPLARGGRRRRGDDRRARGAARGGQGARHRGLQLRPGGPRGDRGRRAGSTPSSPATT